MGAEVESCAFRVAHAAAEFSVLESSEELRAVGYFHRLVNRLNLLDQVCTRESGTGRAEGCKTLPHVAEEGFGCNELCLFNLIGEAIDPSPRVDTDAVGAGAGGRRCLVAGGAVGGVCGFRGHDGRSCEQHDKQHKQEASDFLHSRLSSLSFFILTSRFLFITNSPPFLRKGNSPFFKEQITSNIIIKSIICQLIRSTFPLLMLNYQELINLILNLTKK